MDILKQMLSYNPNHRPNYEDILMNMWKMFENAEQAEDSGLFDIPKLINKGFI